MVQNEEVQIDNIDTHNAAPTWSGYIYQGKVAIYSALNVINNLIYACSDKIEEYSLVIEDLEDFAINKNGNDKSIHQVKAKPNSHNIGNYSEAILLLLAKLEKYPHINEAVLHTATDLHEFTEEQLKKNIKNYDTKDKKRLTDYKNILFDDSADRVDKFDTVLPKLKIANETSSYGIKNVLRIDQIDNIIKQEIKRFYEVTQSEHLYQVEENISSVYAKFVYLIENQVHTSHLKKQKIIIKFTELINILNNESIFDYTEETASLVLLQSMCSQFNHYIDENEIGELDEITYTKKWNEHQHALNILEKKDFYSLCARLTPHKCFSPYKSVNIQELLEVIEPTGIKDVFMRALLETNGRIEVPSDLKDAYVLFEDGKFHSLTTLTDHKNKYRYVGRMIINNINKNNDLSELLFDIDVFVTGYLNNEWHDTITKIKIDEASPIVTKNDNREKITEPKTIKFIDIESFIGSVDI